MSLSDALGSFEASVHQADSLIAHSYQTDQSGNHILPEIDRGQILVAAFLNMYISWEEFLERCLSLLLSGSPTISGSEIERYATPNTPELAKRMIIGVNRFFDYANHQYLKRIVEIYLKDGRPFQPHLDSIYGYLDDLRTMRNSSAHTSSTTQVALETLALRLRGSPSPGIKLHDLLTSTVASGGSGLTVYETYKQHLLAAASLIAHG